MQKSLDSAASEDSLDSGIHSVVIVLGSVRLIFLAETWQFRGKYLEKLTLPYP
jgi:hypothetical protein